MVKKGINLRAFRIITSRWAAADGMMAGTMVTTGRLMLLFGLMMTACVAPHDDARLNRAIVPPDFALTFHVAGTLDPADATNHSSIYVLEPNRQLRVAMGAIATQQYYPPVTLLLPPADFDSIYAFIDQQYLLAEPTSPGAQTIEADEQVTRYTVTIQVRGRTYRFVTTPDESPPTKQLLMKLIDLTRTARLP